MPPGGGEFYRHLRRRHKKRRRQGRYGTGRSLIPGRVSIHGRPARVETRRHPGGGEGDTVAGKKGTGTLVTLVDRKSRSLLSDKPEAGTALAVNQSINMQFGSLPPELLRTLTVDNGKEFARFKTLEDKFAIAVYFVAPYSA